MCLIPLFEQIIYVLLFLSECFPSLFYKWIWLSRELRQELAKVRFSVEKDKAGVTDNTEKVVLKANFYKSVIGVK